MIKRTVPPAKPVITLSQRQNADVQIKACLERALLLNAQLTKAARGANKEPPPLRTRSIT